MKKNCSKQIKKNLEKKKKNNNSISNGNAMIIHLIAELRKNTLYKMSLLNHIDLLEETSMLKLIYLIMQQRQI